MSAVRKKKRKRWLQLLLWIYLLMLLDALFGKLDKQLLGVRFFTLLGYTIQRLLDGVYIEVMEIQPDRNEDQKTLYAMSELNELLSVAECLSIMDKCPHKDPEFRLAASEVIASIDLNFQGDEKVRDWDYSEKVYNVKTAFGKFRNWFGNTPNVSVKGSRHDMSECGFSLVTRDNPQTSREEWAAPDLLVDEEVTDILRASHSWNTTVEAIAFSDLSIDEAVMRVNSIKSDPHKAKLNALRRHLNKALEEIRKNEQIIQEAMSIAQDDGSGESSRFIPTP
jgi:hypothetical protein